MIPFSLSLATIGWLLRVPVTADHVDSKSAAKVLEML
jgi:hypothetical protein